MIHVVFKVQRTTMQSLRCFRLRHHRRNKPRLRTMNISPRHRSVSVALTCPLHSGRPEPAACQGQSQTQGSCRYTAAEGDSYHGYGIIQRKTVTMVTTSSRYAEEDSHHGYDIKQCVFQCVMYRRLE